MTIILKTHSQMNFLCEGYWPSHIISTHAQFLKSFRNSFSCTFQSIFGIEVVNPLAIDVSALSACSVGMFFAFRKYTEKIGAVLNWEAGGPTRAALSVTLLGFIGFFLIDCSVLRGYEGFGVRKTLFGYSKREINNRIAELRSPSTLPPNFLPPAY